MSKPQSAEAIRTLMAEANKAINGISKYEITELRSLNNPPEGIKLVMEAICVLLDVPPRYISGSNTPDYWAASKGLLANNNAFLKMLCDLDKDNIKPQILQKLRTQYIANPEFNPGLIAQKSMACAGLCKYVLMVEQYSRCAVYQ